MGIPKFFRWISERYPLTSQLITPTTIPTFDNLYLDMNGIIHNCSHPPSTEGDMHFRITEEQMILAVYAYIDHLFTKIKPRKVFFMAIDGVAPRAKMNQQRSRRFRTVKENKEAQEKAERQGEVLPEEKAFDSNCITPGTPFMARLSKHLEYFVNKKISEDADWRGVKVIFSGHDVPGEGEHKIQEFIRLNKAQPDYNPNTRHCLYGLDADLIMLGLLSHDPHFCLLREEVTFGRNRKKSGGLAQQNFFLLHLSLLREYLDLEFSSIAEHMPFEYDLERIIDDFILLSVFVGNDFLPHLPNLHINEGAMEEIWNIYKRVLPIAGGYMNDNGTIHVDRVQLVLNDLAKTEVEYFEREYADLNWFKGKQEKEVKALENAKARGKLVLTKDQRAMFDKVEAFVTDLMNVNSGDADKLQFVNNLPARDRTFIQDLADALHVDLLWDEVDEYGQGLVVIAPGMLAAKKRDEDSPVPTREPVSDEEDSGSEEESSDDDAEGKIAVQRVLEKYRKAKVVENIDEDAQKSYDTLLHERLDEWKANYYKTKLETKNDDDVKMVVYKYIEGLQWIMNYYYKGCSSWGWYYPYHYAPRITDFVDLDKMKFNFVLGEPFKPFQQLMGVLPAASAEHIPLAYKDLMYDPNSPILDFYPVEFEEDMNGKKQSWEATVKIPFIDHERLLKAMASRDHRLTADEQARNTLSPHSTLFIYEEGDYIHYPSSLPGSFPDLVKCKCRMEPYTLPELGDGIELITGLIDGVAIGAGALAGFPSMKTLPHHAQLNHHAINVHGQDSRNVSMIITIDNTFDGVKTSELAAKMVGERTFLYWPFLQEGMVVALSDELFRYEKGARGVIATPHEANALINFRKKSQRIESFYSKRFGIVTGQVDVILHVRPLVGLKRMNNGALVKDYSDEEKETEQAVQMTVRQVAFEDERYLEQDPPSLPSEFPLGTRVLFLGDHAFGAAGQVSDVNEKTMNVDLAFFPNEARENASYAQLVHNRPAEKYHPNPLVARGLGVSPLGISRIMSSVLVETTDGKKYNIGLSLKFDAKGMKVLGYSRKNDRGWEFSQTAYELCARYKHEFPDVFEAIQGNDRGVASSRQMFPNAPNPDTRVKQVREWLKDNGVLDFDPVTLFAEQLDKGTVKALEDAADQLNHQRSLSKIKRMVIKSVPRQALLKPAHAIYRLQGQTFGLGDRVVMAQDAAVGGVQLSMKGIVIGLNANSIDVVWDSPFIGGETLNGRCSEHRGSVVPFSSCLNLSRKQFSVSTGAAPQAVGQKPNFQPRFGPQPVVPGNHFRPNQNYQAQSGAASQGFRPRPHQQGPMHYGNAAQGVRPSPPPSSAPRQQVQILQNALAGKAGPVRPPQGNGHSASANAHAPQTAADAHQMLQQLQQGGHTNSHTRPPRGGRGGFSVRPPVNGHTLQEHGTPPAVRPTRGTSRGRGSGTRGRGTSRTPATGPEMQT